MQGTGAAVESAQHGMLLGVWVRERRERIGLRQEDLADRMAERGVVVDRNWITQLETGRKKRMVEQPAFSALVRAIGATEEEALRAVGLLPAEDEEREPLAYGENDPRWDLALMLAEVPDAGLAAVRVVLEMAAGRNR